MLTADLTMKPEDAAKELAKWKRGKTAQDQLIMKAYRAIARGGKLIDLHESFKKSGCDLTGKPYLALARADATRVRGSIDWKGDVEFRSNIGRYSRTDYVFPRNLWAGLVPWKGEVEARVPIIPPEYRRSNLAAYRILFEAAWGTVTEDPLLLEPLGGALYRVIAHWDLTVIEQAVLRGALRT